jgi:hypothetical protein
MATKLQTLLLFRKFVVPKTDFRLVQMGVKIDGELFHQPSEIQSLVTLYTSAAWR